MKEPTTDLLNGVDEGFLRRLETSSFHRAVSVDAEPLTLLERWRVRLVHANFDNNGDSIHVMGWAQYEGRVSSPIKVWDATAMATISRSGRRYELVGPPGHDPDADYVWERWISRNGNPEWEDVTEKYLRRETVSDENIE